MANYKKWTTSETDFIKNNHLVMSDEKLALKLSEMTGQNITTAMIRRQRRKLVIRKSRGRPPKNKVASENNEALA
jgi:hypothetical protein